MDTIRLSSSMCSSVQNADKLNKKLDVNLDPAIFLTTDVLAPKKNSTPLAKKLVAHYDQAPLIDVKICSRTDNANAITKELVVKNKNLLALGSKKCSLTDNAKGLRQSLNVYANALVILDHPKLCSQIVKGVTLIQKVTANSNKTVILNKFLCSLVERGMLPRKGKSVWIDRPIPVEPPDAPDSFLIIPTRTTYIMNHTVSIKIEDGTDIHFSSFSINHSIDSYSFSFSANLIDKGQVNLLLSTEPVRLFINVDGVDFVVIVTDITESLAFNSRGISVEAVSLSALLDAPYANISSNTYASNATVQQLFDLHLTTGWTETWVGNPWIVEGGAYSYSEKTPIQAMAEISNSIGYVIIPSFDSQSLSVQPRYKILAHKFYDENTVTDVFIPESVVISSSKQNQVDSKINGVYVHGGEIGGQIGFCRIDGTAGDVLAPTISNNLMTDPAALRALGNRVLSKYAQQPVVKSFTIPFDNVDVPLIRVGQFIGAMIDGVEIRGIVNSCVLSYKFADITQTITIGESTPGGLSIFRDLIQPDPLLVGTMTSTDEQTSFMTLLGGGVMRVRGTGTVGNKYYLRSGKIDGDAPNLTQQEIVI